MRAASALALALLVAPAAAFAALAPALLHGPAAPGADLAGRVPGPGAVHPLLSNLLHPPIPFTRVECPLAPPNSDPLRPLEVCNLRASAGTGPASEVHLAMNPADPLHLVVVAKAYNATRTLEPGDPNALVNYRPVITNYATTFDGGLTWAEGYIQLPEPILDTPLLGPIGGSEEQGSDPIVAFAPDGSVLVVTLRVTTYPVADGLPVFRSTDGGLTFQRLSDAYPLGQPDKQWIAVDHVRGIVYVATADFASGRSGVWVTRSLDSGATWSPPVKVCACFHPGIDVGPNGEVYVEGIGSGSVWFIRSLDQGQTWSTPQRIAPYDGSNLNPLNGRLFRTPNIPVLAASKVDGGVFVTYANPAEGAPAVPCNQADALCHDVYVLVSRDRGATWSAPIRLNDDEPASAALAEQFMPAIAVSPNGRDVHVAWLDQRHDPTGMTYTAMYAHSFDGGVNWEANLMLSDLPVPAAVSFHQNPLRLVGNGVFLGDYIGLAASDERAVVAWADTRYGRADIMIATVV